MEAAASQKQRGHDKRERKPQVDIDLKFFQTNFVPKLHRTLVTSIRQDASASLFNLILAMRIALLQEQVTAQESRYFFRRLLLLDNF